MKYLIKATDMITNYTSMQYVEAGSAWDATEIVRNEIIEEHKNGNASNIEFWTIWVVD